MAGLGLNPDPKILVIQGLVFVGALASSNYFFIKPALRLFNERRKRTSVAVMGAKDLEARATAMEKAYQDEIKAKTEIAKELRSSEVIAGQAEVQSILAQAIEQAQKSTEAMARELESAIKEERAQLPRLVEDVSESVLRKLGMPLLLAVFLHGVLHAVSSSSVALAAGGGPVDLMYGILWPYFQFVCFLVGAVYFGRKTMNAVLESRRDALRTKLSEAKQAVVLAERRSKELEERLSNLKKEIEELQSSYIQEGVAERDRLVSEAKATATNMLKDAQRAANEMVLKARAQLRKDLVELAFDSVEKRLSAGGLASLDTKLKSEATASFARLSK